MDGGIIPERMAASNRNGWRDHAGICKVLRSTLVVGATALLQHVRNGRGKSATPWLLDLLKRKPPKLVAVALANKIARIAWRLMMTGEKYRGNSELPSYGCAP
jgi:transposase